MAMLPDQDCLTEPGVLQGASGTTVLLWMYAGACVERGRGGEGRMQGVRHATAECHHVHAG